MLLPSVVIAAMALVKASSFGWNATNATEALQRALDSGAETVVIDRQDSPWVCDPLVVRSNTRVVFEDGVVVEARKGGFLNPHDSLFVARNVKNVAFLGRGRAMIRMHRDDYMDETRYKRSEFRMAIILERVKGAVVKDLIIRGSGGDGVYVDGVERGLVERVTSEDNVRQGLSVVSCRDLTIRDCVFVNTDGRPPMSGIDIEPDGARDHFVGLRIENCAFIGNSGDGLEFHLGQLNHDSEPLDILVRNCRMHGNRRHGIKVGASDYSPCTGSIRFEGCRSSGNVGEALLIERQVAGAARLSFKDCEFDGRCSTAAVIRVNHRPYVWPFGSVDFDGVAIRADVGTEPFSFESIPGAGASDLVGGLTVAQGTRREFSPVSTFLDANRPRDIYLPFAIPAKRIQERKLKPANPGARGSCGFSTYCWGAGTFLQYVPGAGTYPIFFRKSLAGAGTRPVIRVRVMAPSGGQHDSFVTDGLDDYTYELKATEKGVYRFLFTAYEYAVAIDSEFPGQGMLADIACRIWRTRKNPDQEHRFYFRVQPNAPEVAVMVGTACSSAGVELLTPEGKVIDADRGKDGKVLFVRARRAKTAKPETWSIRYDNLNPRSDIMLGSGCGPTVCNNPEMALEEYE